MLERVHIENYKCLRDVTVDLGDFTILIGPNDSGKSSFLEVIQTLGTIAQQPFGTSSYQPPSRFLAATERLATWFGERRRTRRSYGRYQARHPGIPLSIG